MIPGIELWPDQADDQPIAQADLDLLLTATAGLGDVVLKVRWFQPRHLAQLAEAVPGARFLTRPRSEGYTAGDIAEGLFQARGGIERAGLGGRWLCHEIANEPNHPGSADNPGPYRDVGAEDYCVVVQNALRTADTSGVPLGSPGLTPYYGTAVWARALSRFGWRWRCGHAYWERHHVEDGVADALAQTDGADAGRVVITEVGDATVGELVEVRLDRTRQALQMLADRGVAGACVFILRAPGWEHYQLGAGSLNLMLRSIRPMTGGTMRPVSSAQLGEGFAELYRRMSSTTGEPLEAEWTMTRAGEGPVLQTVRFQRGMAWWFPAGNYVVWAGADGTVIRLRAGEVGVLPP